MPDMRPVPSSNVKAVGFDPATRELHVEFKGGGIYVYGDVPPEKHEALMAAQSIGGHLFRHIRGQHPHRKLEPETR